MINLIIFSKDRAFQLEGLLSSIQVNCNIFDKINVITKATSAEFRDGYNLLTGQYKDVNFIPEVDFKEDLISLMGGEYTCFMVDDLIAYRKLKGMIYVTGESLMTKKSNGFFSLRLGMNIRRCEQRDFTESNKYECCFTYDWTTQPKSGWAYWGYPFSLDGHIFRTDYILPMIKDREYTNPNKLEIAFNRYKDAAPKYMSCFNESVVVSIPINRVSDTASASYGEKYPHTAKELNERFLNGERMSWKLMDFSNIKLPHQEVDIIFKKI